MILKQDRNARNTLMFWVGWMAVSVIGFTLAGLLLHFPSGFPPNNGAASNPPAFVFGMLIGGLSGLAVGGLQALVLRQYFLRVRMWVVANIVGVGVVHGIGDALPDPAALLTVEYAGGVILGIVLWLAVKNTRASSPLRIGGIAVAWFVGFGLGLFLANNSGMGWEMAHVVVGLTMGVTIALASGALLVFGKRDIKTQMEVHAP